MRIVCIFFLLALPISAFAQDVEPAPGELVDVGGYQLHIYCAGDKSEGEPTVILDNGITGWSLELLPLVDEIANFAHVCTYDRAGYGWSEAGPMPRTAQQIANELYNLLNFAEIAPPYLLVGHAYSGLSMSLFASQHLEETDGLILVDGTPPTLAELYTEFPTLAQLDALQITQLEAVLELGDVPIETLSALITPELIPATVPSDFHETFRVQFFKAVATMKSEFESLFVSADSAKELFLEEVPVMVLAATEPRAVPGLISDEEAIEQQIYWIELQTEQLALSENATFVLVEEANSRLYLDKPEAVIDAIRQMLES